jgi:DNA-binding SARP family transcriptional activator/tetratricopeptide (TPR) repeat protein
VLEFRILGPLEVLAEGRPLVLGGLKQRALLALLLIEANRVVSIERLIGVLWEGEPTETAGKALQVYVSQLRKLVGRERVQTKAPGYLLRVDDDELDLTRFQQLQKDGRLEEALALWRGPPLAEFAALRSLQGDAARLEELRLACLEEHVEQELAAGRHVELVGELDTLVRAQPLRQRLRGQQMLALYRAGRDVDALAAYTDLRTGLVDELGIEPRRELRELQLAILNQDPLLDLVEAVPEMDRGRGAFVGRDGELAELLAGLDDAFAGQGRLFLVGGEPGIGKSRLADELIGRARARGARVLVGRCWEAGGAPAYWPWVESLRAYIREGDADTVRAQLGTGAADLAQLLPELRELDPGLAEPPAAEPEGARFRLFEAAAAFLVEASRARALVLVLDDLHAADEPSLLLLQFLARRLRDSRLLVVGAYRDVDPSPSEGLTAALTELVREPATSTLTLAGFGEGDIARFIELTAGEASNEGLVAALHEETDGNPLFVGEMVRLLATEGTLDHATEASELAIPQSVRDVIARRLRHLSPECNRVLLVASVLGREFGLDALASVSGTAEDELLETLDEAMVARAVSDIPGIRGRLRFSHVLIRDTLYESLTGARRVRQHRLAVGALETLYGDEPGPHLAELAHHALAGSDFDRALRYAQRAAERALVLLAYEEAARLNETALDALELAAPDDERTRLDLLLALGEAQARAGEMTAAKDTYLAASELARRLELPRELAQAAVGYGGRIAFERASSDTRLVPLLEEGLASLDEDDVELRVKLLARLGGALRDEPSRERRDRLTAKAIELARGIDDVGALLSALDGRAAAINGPDNVAERLALATELCSLAERSGDLQQGVHGNIHLYLAHLELGNPDEAVRSLEAATRAAERLRQPAQLWQVHGGRAMLAIATGDLVAAEDLISRAFAFGERSQRMATGVFWLQRYALLDFFDDLTELEPVLEELIAGYPSRPVFRCVLAHLYARLGRLDAARVVLDELAADDFSLLPFDMEWLFGMSVLAETSTLVGDAPSAAGAHRLLAPWAGSNVIDMAEGMRGSVSRYLGLLATTLGRFDEAAAHYDAALAMNERMNARPWLAHTQADYARMLCARDAPGDHERAGELLRLARTTYGELGLTSRADAAVLS